MGLNKTKTRPPVWYVNNHGESSTSFSWLKIWQCWYIMFVSPTIISGLHKCLSHTNTPLSERIHHKRKDICIYIWGTLYPQNTHWLKLLLISCPVYPSMCSKCPVLTECCICVTLFLTTSIGNNKSLITYSIIHLQIKSEYFSNLERSCSRR